MANYKRKKMKQTKKYQGYPRNGWWSKRAHKWWKIDFIERKKNARVAELEYALV